MSRRVNKVGANDTCPCGRLKKYKFCCRGIFDWETPTNDEAVRRLVTRGKNLMFINLVLDALQFGTERAPTDRRTFKRAFTSTAVKKIFEAVEIVWPDGEDLKRVLRDEGNYTSGLYLGQYQPDLLMRGVTRHSLYADRILLVDPLPHPKRMRAEFNPLLHPSMFRSTAVQFISMWLDLYPWIHEGIVGFIRDSGDFYPELMVKAVEKTKTLYDTDATLRQLVAEGVDEALASKQHMELVEDLFLSHSDEWIRAKVREDDPQVTSEKVELLIADMRRRRDDHPYYLEPEDTGGLRSELQVMSTGTNYELAKVIALHSKSYLMTDLRPRWREIELDREQSGIDMGAWSPLAKAFGGLKFSFLDSVPLGAALVLRREGRLEPMRGFLRKVWDATSNERPFDDANVPALAAELDQKVREAEAEWLAIDRDLTKLVTAQAITGAIAAGPAIASGYAAFLAAAGVAAGVGNLIHSNIQRREHKLKYPAGFFVDLKQGRFD